MRTVRLSNIELLRIIAMFAIVLFYSIYHGNYGITSFKNRNEIYIKFVQAFGEIGVNIFMLISGYFLIMIHKEISVKRIINIWIPCVFYSIIITLVYSIFGVSDFVWGGVKGIIQIFLPIVYNKWWFATVYLVLLCFSPYISEFIIKKDKIQYKKMLLIMFILWCCIPTFTRRDMYCNRLVWCFFLYCLAGYIRKFSPFKRTSGFYFALGGGILGAEYALTFFIDYFRISVPLFGENVPYFYDYKYLPTFLVAVLIFIAFTKINIGSIWWLNKIASAMFGVYLIHDHPLVRKLLWSDIFRFSSENSLFIVYSILSVVITFTLCILIELSRKKGTNLIKEILKSNITSIFH